MKKALIYFFLIIGTIILMACTDEKKTNITTRAEDVGTTTITTTQKSIDKYFESLTYEEEILENETTIISLNELVPGTIKERLNPYKTSSILIDAYITTPSGKTDFRPGYWTQDFKMSLNSLIQGSDWYSYEDELKGTDSATKKGIEHFNVSYKAKEKGIHELYIEVFVGGVLVEKINSSFEVMESSAEYKGKIVVNDTNERYFMYEETGETYVPVGMNNCWYTSKTRKSYDYEEWFSRMSNVGCNWSRIWMSAWGFALHIGTGAEVDDFTNRLNQAARLERVLQVAEDEGIYIFLTMNNHGQFSEKTNAEWDNNPYNKIISKPYQFFSTQACKDIYKDEIRYIVARYGTYDSLMAYELFNEVDWTDYSSMYDNQIKSWHKEMATYLSSIDCYDRLITTSYKGTLGSAFQLDEMDIACIHSYAFTNHNPITYTISEIAANYRNYNKIVMFAEWGVHATSGADTYAVDPEGISLYQGMWASVLGGGSGTVMNWWWESYIHPNNLYELYRGIAAYSERMNLNGNLTYLTSSDISISNGLSQVSLKVDDRVYSYVYDSTYSRISKTENTFKTHFSMVLNDGTYRITVMNPRSGEVVSEFDQETGDGVLTFMVPEFTTDIALIIEKQ